MRKEKRILLKFLIWKAELYMFTCDASSLLYPYFVFHFLGCWIHNPVKVIPSLQGKSNVLLYLDLVLYTPSTLKSRILENE